MSKIELFNLEYTNERQNNYANLAHLPGFVLLESAERSAGRYDIISAFPYQYVKGYSRDEWFSQAEKLLFKQEKTGLDLPFQGGAIGYVAYDLGAELAGIPYVPQSTLKGMPLFELGLYDWALIVDHQLKKITLFAAHTQTETAGLVEEIKELWNNKGNKEISFQLESSFMPLIKQSEYQQAFTAIQRDLHRGRSYQVNYTQPFQVSYTGETWGMYERVRRTNPVPFSAFLRTKEADILSFSPERFLLMEEDYVLTSPIKGTHKRSLDLVEDKIFANELLTNLKYRAENVMIVDLLRHDLGKIAQTGSVVVPSLCGLESYQGVHHLVSHIEARALPSLSALDIFSSCFPGGSITGAPKLETMHIIAEQEPFARGIYCGAIGYFSRHGRMDMNIAIRTMIARENTLHMAAGGGIIIDSKWEEEYEECLIKMAAVVNGLK